MLKNLMGVVGRLAIHLFLAVGAGHAVAQALPAQTPPDALIKTLVTEVMGIVRADKDMQGGNIQKISALVDQKIMPNANFERTTRLAMGRHWSKATPEQQQLIAQEFKQLLIHTYSGAVVQIRDQTVQYRPFRAGPDDTEVVVRTFVQGRGEPVQIDYRLEKTANGWKVYDLNVLGAWLVETYRNQFNEMINRNGIDGLVKFLQDRNRQLASAK